nr:EOG090X0BFL [Simocephalus serrulatus]
MAEPVAESSALEVNSRRPRGPGQHASENDSILNCLELGAGLGWWRPWWCYFLLGICYYIHCDQKETTGLSKFHSTNSSLRFMHDSLITILSFGYEIVVIFIVFVYSMPDKEVSLKAIPLPILRPILTQNASTFQATLYAVLLTFHQMASQGWAMMKIQVFIIFINMKCYKLLCNLLNSFPCSFSIGEAVLVIQGAIVFIFITVQNLLLLPFTFLLLTVMGVLVLPTMFWVLKKNPVIWFLVDFVFLNSTRVLLIGYWVACTISALTIAWRYGGGSSIKLTVLRKYFHGVVIAVYLPGIFLDFELLFVASVIVLAAFILLESIRVYNLEYVGDILNNSMTGFLDEKDQGILILTHIYLLVGCSLPIWIFPLKAAADAKDYLLLCSGVVSLGIGDTAASIGGTWWGKTKYPGSSKSVEGTLCSISAEIFFFFALFYSGALGASSLAVPWSNFIISAVVSSLVEAYTTQVDNLVLPLVMYILLII